MYSLLKSDGLKLIILTTGHSQPRQTASMVQTTTSSSSPGNSQRRSDQVGQVTNQGNLENS